MQPAESRVPGHRRVKFPAPLLERGRELEAFGRVFAGLDHRAGSLLVIEGPAGIGKTRLLGEAVALGRARGILTRSAHAGELERGLPFGLARQLFEPVLERASAQERTRLLAGSAAAAKMALGRRSSRRQADPFGAIHGLYWLLANLTEDRRVLIAVDDAHWGDRQSLRFLDYLSRRLEDMPVAAIVCARSGEPDEPPELERIRAEAEVLRARPLSVPAVDALIRAELGSSATAEFSAACARATAGNPFLLAEVLRSLRADVIDPTSPAALAVLEHGPERVTRHVLTRVGRFGDDAIALAQAIAVLGRAPQLRHAAQLAGLEGARAAELCDRLRHAELLAPGQPVSFVHPLVRAAVYSDLAEGARSALHRRAAEGLAVAGAGPREIAPHLLACAPNGDQWVVRQLRAAAGEATAAGAHDTAAAHLERALEEPPDDDLPVRYELGRALFEADPARSPDVLADVAQRADDAALKVAALRLVALGHFRAGNLAAAATGTQEALEALPEGDREQALLLEAHLYLFAVLPGRNVIASERIRSVAAGAEAGTYGGSLVRQALAYDLFADSAPVDEVVALAASPSPERWEVGGIRVLLPSVACKVLACCGHWEAARAEAVRFLEAAERQALLVGVSTGYAIVAEVDRLGGRLADAEVEARTAWEIAKAFAPLSPFGWMASMNLLATHIARGNLEAAGEMTGRLPMTIGPREIPTSPWPIELRGYLRLAQGDLAGAVDDLLALGEATASVGHFNPALCAWRQAVAPALGQLGRVAEAEEIIRVADERARTFNAPHVIGTVLRAKALLQPRGRQVDALRESVAALALKGPPHELALSLIELGAALRRAGRRREAPEPLRRALELAHRCGAGGLETRAREELGAVGSRPRSVFASGVGSLTASELRVAKLAADGLNNREIAERIFVTRRTVETHLTHVYAKLGIPGRDALPGALET